MFATKTAFHQFLQLAVITGLTLLGSSSSRASDVRNAASVQRLDAGTYSVELKPPHNWEAEVNRESGYVVFQFNDRPAMTVTATLGLFRIVVPAEVRSADPLRLAGAYVTNDLSGAQKALFGSNARLISSSKKPKPVNEGRLFSFAEPIDASGIRTESTAFVRGWVFFPKNYVADGVIFLLLGRQKSPTTELRPTELEWTEELVAAIRR